MPKQFCLFIFFLFHCLTISLAQYPYSIKLTYPDPLPTPVIYDMKGDSKGYIWLATDKGLIRFNSRNFQILPFTKTASKSVGYIQEAPDGTIWCVNFYKQIFYVKNDTVCLFEVKDKRYEKLNNILNIAVTNTGIFIASFNAIIEINKENGTIRNCYEKNNYSDRAFQHITTLHNDVFAFGKKSAVYNLKDTVNTFGSLYPFIEMRLAADTKKILGVERGTRKRKAVLFDGKKIQTLPDFQLPVNAYLYHLSVTTDDEFWLCTQNGAYKWDYETGNTELLFPNERVSDIVKDFQGNYWISTLDNGLFKCPNLNCKKLPSVFSTKNDIVTRILLLPNSNIIAGNTRGEIIEFESSGKIEKKFESVTKDEIEFLYMDNKNNFLFSDGGMFNHATGNIISKLDFGKGVAKDINGNIIMASFNRCVVATNSFDKIDSIETPERIPLYKKLNASLLGFQGQVLKKSLVLRNKRSNAVLADKNGKGFWVAYDDGLYNYQYNGEIKIIRDEKNQPIVATHLYQMPDETLIVCTPFNGLLILNNNKIIKRYSTTNGLHSNNTKRAVFFRDTIWLLTDESLDVIDYKSGKVQDFYSSCGIEPLNVYDIAIADNHILLATAIGILSFTPNEKNKNEKIKITHIDIESFGEKISNDIKLPYNKNEITITVDALHYTSPSKLLLHYRLIGADAEWKSNNAFSNTILYKALPPGKYTYEIFASDINNEFRSLTETISFNIDYPFWKKAWFISLSVFCIISLLFLMGRWWVKSFKQRQTIKERVLHSKLIAIRSQMNPHFLYNVLNTVQGLVYANKKNEAGETLGNFSDLMRMTLKESDKAETSLQDEVESLKLYLELEKQRFDNDFEYKIIMDVNIRLSEIFIPPMVIQPFAENAIKHGLLHKHGDKKLLIKFLLKENTLEVKIDDNGIGRMQSGIINKNNKSKSTGFALKAIDERISIFNEMNKVKIKLKIMDKEDGTLVELELPVVNTE